MRSPRDSGLGGRHREWVNRLPPLLRADGTDFDKTAVVLYAYRHTYAQRHADAGVPADVSYLPDLQAYIDDLLRNRERLTAVTEADAWAKDEAMPSDEEITRVGQLIRRVKTDLDRLSTEDGDQVDQAITVASGKRGRQHAADPGLNVIVSGP